MKIDANRVGWKKLFECIEENESHPLKKGECIHGYKTHIEGKIALYVDPENTELFDEDYFIEREDLML